MSIYADPEETLLMDKLDQLRGELRLQAALAKGEIKSHWEALEERWTLLQSRLSILRVAREETAEEVKAAVKLLVHELKEGYERMRSALARL